MDTKEAVFEANAYGYHGHHWIVRNAQKYLSLQTQTNEIKMYAIDAKDTSFKEDESIRIFWTAVTKSFILSLIDNRAVCRDLGCQTEAIEPCVGHQ